MRPARNLRAGSCTSPDAGSSFVSRHQLLLPKPNSFEGFGRARVHLHSELLSVAQRPHLGEVHLRRQSSRLRAPTLPHSCDDRSRASRNSSRCPARDFGSIAARDVLRIERCLRTPETALSSVTRLRRHRRHRRRQRLVAVGRVGQRRHEAFGEVRHRSVVFAPVGQRALALTRRSRASRRSRVRGCERTAFPRWSKAVDA